MLTTVNLSETALCLLKAVAALPVLSSNVLLQAIVRGQKFGTLSELYEGRAQWGVLSDKSLNDVQCALDGLVSQGLLKRRAGYSSRVVVTELGLEYLKKDGFMPTATKTFSQVRTQLVEDGVRRLYESYIDREILVHSAYVYSAGDPNYQRFDSPLRARVLSQGEQQTEDLVYWPDTRHLDPYWPVVILEHGGQLGSDDRVYEVDGLGWAQGVGFEKSVAAWSLAEEVPND